MEEEGVEEVLGEAGEGGEKRREKKHNSGAGDLERVTDVAEEAEVKADLSSLSALRAAQAQTREKISVRKEDVASLVAELNLSKALAERKLRAHNGSLYHAINDLLRF